jgi:hypothetical protein
MHYLDRKSIFNSNEQAAKDTHNVKECVGFDTNNGHRDC